MIGTRRGAAVVVMLSSALAACGGDGGAGACLPVERIVIPGSNLHVIDGDDVTYEISPPTSGPHQLPAPESGVHDSPVSEPRQVSALEAGMVVVQYGDSVSSDDIDRLRSLAGDRVLVTPAARVLDDGATVAFTAWVHRQLCSTPDVEAAEAFIEDHLPAAPAADHD